MASQRLSTLPAPLSELGSYIAQHPELDIDDILDPYRRYEAQLRTIYARNPDDPMLRDPYLNALPIFINGNATHITTRARDLSSESEEQMSKFIMPLPDDKRRPQGSLATVANLAEFQENFSVFSETSLLGLDWNNVVAAGSSVVNCLLPVPEAFKRTRRTLREYYHEKFCPASDVDLFLYGLNHEEAIAKIKEIERAIKDVLLHEVTVVRTKYAITIASQYPVRHVQIVLRVYKSLSEILTGFDIDASGAAYDGKQVYVTPRALGSYITQINQIDLTRRSPSYENRLSKYSHRNFEVFWPELDRSRVDPTIFERSFKRTLGLARLLVLERLPTMSLRDEYMDQRRKERGRPAIDRGYFRLVEGNLKDKYEDEIAEWAYEEEVSSYNTFTIPYGQKYNAKRIEKLCYSRDLLLNAEWNQKKNNERKVNLHRHPAFFGRFKDVMKDCCGSCPKPKTEEELEIAAKEGQRYISGELTFLVDDPGRQEIGSFNPLTEKDWTDMAYVGNTARLCQSIVDGNLDEVKDWLSQDGADINQRDYTGRTPLQLAVTSSTPEIVQHLVDNGARMISRLADGRTALHLAASRGNSEMIKILMKKSLSNEEAEEEKKKSRNDGKTGRQSSVDPDIELVDSADSDSDDDETMATNSFIKIRNDDEEHRALDGSMDDPDIYDIDVLAWDVPCSPLHLAIAGGHEDCVKTLCDYGADSILPVKYQDRHRNGSSALLTLTLALALPQEKASPMAKLLCSLGAISSQAESNGATAFHRYVASGEMDMIDTLLECDISGVKKAINHIYIGGFGYSPATLSVLHSAINLGDKVLSLKLLNTGAEPDIKLETWLKSAKFSPLMAQRLGDLERNRQFFKANVEQPLIHAIFKGQPEIAVQLLESGANPNMLLAESEGFLNQIDHWSYSKGYSALDIVEQFGYEVDRIIQEIGQGGKEGVPWRMPKPQAPEGTEVCLKNYFPGTYKYWVVSEQIEIAIKTFTNQMALYEKSPGREPKTNAGREDDLKNLREGYKSLRDVLISKGAQHFAELHPDIKPITSENYPGIINTNPLFHQTQTKFDWKFDFWKDDDITELRREGYLDLMEAAWSGDIERMKALTLRPWGHDLDQPPLKMAVRDNAFNTPFSLAFLRGHYEAARVILEVVKSQWVPKEGDRMHYRMRTEGNDDENSDNDADDDENEEMDDLDIVAERVNDKTTIDDIGTTSMKATSTIKPFEFLQYAVPGFVIKEGKAEGSDHGSLFMHAFKRNDVVGMNFLIDQAQYWVTQKFEASPDSEKTGEKKPGNNDMQEGENDEDDDDDEDEDEEMEEASDEGEDKSDDLDTENDIQTIFRFPNDAFQYGIGHGKTELLSLVIARTGAGIPWELLIEQSGLKVEKKSKYYQGLDVYGKKRSDWANAGRTTLQPTFTGLYCSPLLCAASMGSIQSVEYFLSDTPHRLFSEFGSSSLALDDPQMKLLNQTSGGYQRAYVEWLTKDSDFVIHWALQCKDMDLSGKLIKYLINVCPRALEKKNANGETPLAVACREDNFEIIKILVEANADQSVRLDTGENLLHILLKRGPPIDFTRKVFDLLNPTLRSHLFLQREKLAFGGSDPIHSWISIICLKHTNGGVNWNEIAQTLHLLLEYSNGQALELLDGAGNTALHTAVMHRHIALTRILIQFKPQLLYRENAVGRTPAELAYDSLTASQLTIPSPLDSGRIYYNAGSVANLLQTIDAGRMVNTTVKSGSNWRAKLHEIGLTSEYDMAEAIYTVAGFVKGESIVLVDNELAKRVIWDLCNTAMNNHRHPRQLVSLNEANDVAKRLGEQYAGQRYCSNLPNRNEEDSERGDDKGQ